MSNLPINQIIQGDCLEVMKTFPDKSVDLILTDPPYGLNYNQNDLASQWEKVFGGNLDRMKPRPIATDGEAESKILLEAMLAEARRILKPGCCCCCCGGGGPKPLFAEWTLLMDKYLDFKQAVVWRKPGLGMGIHYRRCYEFVLVAIKPGGSCVWNGGNTTSNVIDFSKIIPADWQHPTQKPVELMKFFVNLHSNSGDVVLDPFAGSGSTLVAAKELGRNYIGIELSPEYCKMAEERLAQGFLWEVEGVSNEKTYP